SREARRDPGPGGVIAMALFQLIPPMPRNRGVGVQRKAVDTGTARAREPWCLALGTKARADAAHLLPGSFPEGDALLHGSGHGAGELWCGVAQWVIPGGHGGLQARLEIPQPA